MKLTLLEYPARELWPEICNRPFESDQDAFEIAQEIIAAVREKGDEALHQLTKRFNNIELKALRVTESEFAGSADQLAADLKQAITTARRNIEIFHRAQIPTVEFIKTMPGVLCWRRAVPIERVGLYVPGGSAPLISTALMLAVPASLAGCHEIALCTPPDQEGKIHPAILHVCNLLNITEVYKVGGAQAVAALAHGTQTIKKVDKIFGPGNRYVTAAKQLVNSAGVAIDMPAGPSELAIIADGTARADFIAADLLSQAEHGADSQVLLVVLDHRILLQVQEELQKQLAELSRREIACKALEHSRAVLLSNLKEALELVNLYAPEHLIIATSNPAEAAQHVINAGSVFLGNFTPESAGDYASGTNHTLPTGGYVRTLSGLSMESFSKMITFQELSPAGAALLGPTVETLAEAEGLAGHAGAMRRRREVAESDPAKQMREAVINRKTKETAISAYLNLDGSGIVSVFTGIGFFDHMLELMLSHAGFDARLDVQGDLHVDEHHTTEDVGIVLGHALHQALGDKRGIERYGFTVPMDDALAEAALDLSGRAYLQWEVSFKREKLGELATEMIRHFFYSLCNSGGLNLVLRASGDNEHHKAEAVFKVVGRALRQAVRIASGLEAVPSTKGLL